VYSQEQEDDIKLTNTAKQWLMAFGWIAFYLPSSVVMFQDTIEPKGSFNLVSVKSAIITQMKRDLKSRGLNY
jgi:hypothetical protein